MFFNDQTFFRLFFFFFFSSHFFRFLAWCKKIKNKINKKVHGPSVALSVWCKDLIGVIIRWLLHLLHLLAQQSTKDCNRGRGAQRCRLMWAHVIQMPRPRGNLRLSLGGMASFWLDKRIVLVFPKLPTLDKDLDSYFRYIRKSMTRRRFYDLADVKTTL